MNNSEEEDVVTEEVIKVKSNFYEFYDVEFVRGLHCEMRQELENRCILASTGYGGSHSRDLVEVVGLWWVKTHERGDE